MREIVFLIIVASTCLCNFAKASIFLDQQRQDVSPWKYPFVIGVGSGSGYILDAEKNIAITAYHIFSNNKTAPICFGVQNNYWVTQPWNPDPSSIDFINKECPYPGLGVEVLESSIYFDYVIFRFVMPRKPHWMSSIKLVVENNLLELIKYKTDIFLVGYPMDKYQQGRLTESHCQIRADKALAMMGEVEMSSVMLKLYRAWEADPKYYFNPLYNSLRIAFINIHALDRQDFSYDCSAYAGNSGGPVFFQDSKTKEYASLGFPAGGRMEPSSNLASNDPCEAMGEIYNQFFAPILNMSCKSFWDTYKIVDPIPQERWDKLDRNTDPLKAMPRAIPMYRIVKQSNFLNQPENKKYLYYFR